MHSNMCCYVSSCEQHLSAAFLEQESYCKTENIQLSSQFNPHCDKMRLVFWRADGSVWWKSTQRLPKSVTLYWLSVFCTIFVTCRTMRWFRKWLEIKGIYLTNMFSTTMQTKSAKYKTQRNATQLYACSEKFTCKSFIVMNKWERTVVGIWNKKWFNNYYLIFISHNSWSTYLQNKMLLW